MDSTCACLDGHAHKALPLGQINALLCWVARKEDTCSKSHHLSSEAWPALLHLMPL